MACNNCQECNPCSPTSCVQENCACAVFLEDTCITTTEDMPYTGITSGKTLGEWILSLDEYLQSKLESIENFFKLKNVGVGVGKIYKGISILGEKEIKSIKGTDLITVNNLTEEVEIEVNESALIAFIGDSDTYSISNVGTGAGVYKNSTVVGLNTQFNLRKIKSSDGSVTVTEETDDINLSVVIPDGSETKINAGTNTTVTGSGTTATPFVINSTDTNTTYSAGTAISLVGTTFNNTAPDQTVTLTQGGGTTITGTYPNFTISSATGTTYTGGTSISVVGSVISNTAPDQVVALTQSGATTIAGTYPNFTISSTDTNTTYSAGIGLSLTGTEFSLGNPQFLLTTSGITLNDIYNNGTFIIDNGATPITITIPDTLTTVGFCAGFYQKGTGDVNFITTGTATIFNPIGYKIQGQGYQAFVERHFNSDDFGLLGNTKI